MRRRILVLAFVLVLVLAAASGAAADVDPLSAVLLLAAGFDAVVRRRARAS